MREQFFRSRSDDELEDSLEYYLQKWGMKDIRYSATQRCFEAYTPERTLRLLLYTIPIVDYETDGLLDSGIILCVENLSTPVPTGYRVAIHGGVVQDYLLSLCTIEADGVTRVPRGARIPDDEESPGCECEYFKMTGECDHVSSV